MQTISPPVKQPAPAVVQQSAVPQQPVKNGLSPPNVASQRTGHAHTSQGTGERSSIDMADFDDMAGIKSQAAPQKSLRDRLSRAGQRNTPNRTRSAAQSSGVRSASEAAGADPHLRAAALEALSTLSESGDKAAQERLEEQYDPLQHYVVLHDALRELEESDATPAEKKQKKAQLNGMMSDLVTRHRDAIRQGLKDGQALNTALGAMSDGAVSHHSTLRELRFQYGAKGKGNVDAPLTPLAMAKALEQKFGAESFGSALASLRSKMSGDLRPKDGVQMPAPRLWLSMSDASAFNMVQSSFAIAGELRQALCERARVAPKASHAAMAVTMLSLAERGKANHLLSQAFDQKSASPYTRAIAAPLVYQAVKKMPTTLWREPFQRMNVLDELQNAVNSAHKGVPALKTKAERNEERWRLELGQKTAPAA